MMSDTPSPRESSAKVDEGNVANVQNYERNEAIYEEPAVPVRKNTLWAKFKRSLRRFWWAYLIVALLLAALGILLTIFVGVQSIAQNKINDAVLEVQGISCTNTHTNAFQLSINTTLKSGTTKATVEAFPGVMYLEDEPSHTPFVTIDFPETHNQPFQVVNISQYINITNIPALTTFNTWLLNNESLRVTVLGHPTVKVPGISHGYKVTFKKTITMPGLNGFSGLSVANSSISLTEFSDGSNFHTTATIPNKSIVTFEIVSHSFILLFSWSFPARSLRGCR